MFCEQGGMVQVVVPPEHIGAFQQCGRAIYEWVMARGAWLRFCSDACQLKAQTARQAKREVRTCEYCAEEFEPTRAHAKSFSSAHISTTTIPSVCTVYHP